MWAGKNDSLSRSYWKLVPSISVCTPTPSKRRRRRRRRRRVY